MKLEIITDNLDSIKLTSIQGYLYLFIDQGFDKQTDIYIPYKEVSQLIKFLKENYPEMHLEL